VTEIWAGRPRNWDSIPSRAKGNQFFIVQTVSWVHHPPVLWAYPCWDSGWIVESTDSPPASTSTTNMWNYTSNYHAAS